MVVAIDMRTAIRCPDCETRTPLPGLRTRIACLGCGFDLDVLAIHEEWHEGGVRYTFGG
jgi:hypothetical protein